MGCKSSAPKADGFVQGDLEVAVDYSKLDKYEKFEHTFPFYKTTIKNFELQVNQATNSAGIITIESLKSNFTTAAWKDLQDDNS